MGAMAALDTGRSGVSTHPWTLRTNRRGGVMSSALRVRRCVINFLFNAMDSTFSPFRSLPARGFFRALRTLVPLTFGLAAFAASEPSFVTGQKKSFAYSWDQ